MDVINSKCPCCKSALKTKPISLTTDRGFETFGECNMCGVIYRPKEPTAVRVVVTVEEKE